MQDNTQFDLLANLIKRGGDGVDRYSAVIADLDVFLEKGCTLEQMNHCHLIVDIDSLTEAIRIVRSENQNRDGRLKKLLKMVDDTLLRWECGTLRNSKVESWIDERIEHEIMKRWSESEYSLNDAEKKSGIVGKMTTYLRSIASTILEAYMNQSPNFPEQYQGMDDIVASKILLNYLDKKYLKTAVEEYIQNTAREEFLNVLKTDVKLPMEEVSLDALLSHQWIEAMRINPLYPRIVPALDSYCWELTLAKAGKSCRRNMDDILERSFQEIITKWKLNKLPNIIQLEENIKYFIRGFFDHIRDFFGIHHLKFRPVLMHCHSTAIRKAVCSREETLVELIREIAEEDIKARMVKESHDTATPLYASIIAHFREILSRGKSGAELSIRSELHSIVSDCIKKPIIQTDLITPTYNHYAQFPHLLLRTDSIEDKMKELTEKGDERDSQCAMNKFE